MRGPVAIASVLLLMVSSPTLAQRVAPAGVTNSASDTRHGHPAIDLHFGDGFSLSECTQDRITGIVVGTVLGAGAGWLLYTVSVGALAESHGSQFQRARRQWMLVGAGVGAGWGALAQSPRADCR